MIICNIFGKYNEHKMYKVLGEHNNVIEVITDKLINIIEL